MNASPSPPSRQVWLIIFGALALSVLIYLLIGYFVENGSKPRATNPASVAQLRPFVFVASMAVLIGSVAWLKFRVDGKIGGEGRPVMLSPQQFQSDSIIALALSESCTILGLALFFMGAPLQELVFFALGTLVVDFVCILPRGLQFWANVDTRGNI